MSSIRRRVRPTKQRKLTRVVAVTTYEQRFRYFPRFALRLCRPCEINSETNMAGSSDPTKRAVSVLKEAITKLEESYHLASSSTSDNSSDAVGMASTSASTSSTSREDARRDFR